MVETTVELPPDQVPGSQGAGARGERTETQEEWRARNPLGFGVLSPGESATKAAIDYEKLAGESEKEHRDYITGQEKKSARIDEYERTHPIPSPPQLKNVGPPPDAAQYRQYSMAFMASMAMLAAFGTKTAGVSASDALGSFGAAMKGWSEGNEQAYDDASKRWKQQTEATIQNNENAIKAYDMILKDRSLHTSEMIEQMKRAAVLHNDHVMYNQAREGNINGIFKWRDLAWNATNDAKKAAAPLFKQYDEGVIKRKLEAQDYEELVATDFKNPVTGEEVLKPDGTPFTDLEKQRAKWVVETYGAMADPGHSIPLSDAALDEMVEQRLAGKPKSEILSRLGTGAQGRRDVTRFENRYAEKAKAAGVTPEEQVRRDNAMLGERAGERSVGVMEANLGQVIRNVNKAIPAAIEASEKVPRGSFVPLNKLKQIGEKNISDPNLRDFATKNLMLAELWARAMNIKGVMRNDDRMLALDNLLTADKHETYLVAAKAINDFVNREWDAIEERKRGDPMKKLPDSMFVPKGKGGGAAAPAGGSSGLENLTEEQLLERARKLLSGGGAP